MRIKPVLVGLLAVCAFSLAGAASASAVLPEFMPKAGVAFPIPFHGLIEGALREESSSGNNIECHAMHTVGQFLNGHSGDIHLLIESCETIVIGVKGVCGNKPNPASKEILLEALFHLGYIEPSTKLVGILINSDKSELVSLECELVGIKETIKMTGEVIAHIPSADLDNQRHALTVEFNQNAGKQEYQQITLPLVSETELMTKVHLTAHRGSSEQEFAQSGPPRGTLTVTRRRNRRTFSIACRR